MMLTALKIYILVGIVAGALLLSLILINRIRHHIKHRTMPKLSLPKLLAQK
jgi:hypothetical protein